MPSYCCWALCIYKWSLIYTIDIIHDAFLVRDEIFAYHIYLYKELIYINSIEMQIANIST
jgi:hypothetical protein